MSRSYLSQNTLRCSTSLKLCCLPLNSSSRVMDSVANAKSLNNSSDVDHSQHRGSSELRLQNIVYVLNMRGNPLMPTTQQKANRLLKEGKAKVVNATPFTIQMTIATGETKQPITLGIDAGYNKIGFSVVSSTKELLAGEVQLRKDVSKKLSERRMYRRNRRSKLWYRKSRFLNRVSSKKEGWLAPSIQHKLDSHIRLIKKIESLLPITKVIVEVASFDTQKMQNPEISGIEYQQGKLQGYEVKEYLLEKWSRKCAYCEKKNIPLEIEHIIPKSKGGTDRVSNLTIACNKCNLEKGNQTAVEFGHPEIQKQAKETLKATAFMNVIRWKLVNALGCKWTYGFITKYNRVKLELKKSHPNDAFVIANGNGHQRTIQYSLDQVRRNNRCLQLNRKGFKPSIRRQRYNFQPRDLVRFNDKIYEVKGIFNKGSYIRLKAEKDINTKIENIELYKYMKGLVILLS